MKTAMIVLMTAAAGACLQGCGSAPETQNEKASLASDSANAIDQFRSADPSLQGLLDKSAGYAVLPEVGKGGVVVGGSFGHGEVFEKELKIGYVELAEGTVGLQLGAQVFSELIVFRTKAALSEFKAGNFSFAANATAVAVKPGAAATYDSSSNVVVFTHIKGGLMAEAAIGGQKLTFKPL